MRKQKIESNLGRDERHVQGGMSTYILKFNQNRIFIANHEFAGRKEQFEPLIITSLF